MINLKSAAQTVHYLARGTNTSSSSVSLIGEARVWSLLSQTSRCIDDMDADCNSVYYDLKVLHKVQLPRSITGCNYALLAYDLNNICFFLTLKV